MKIVMTVQAYIDDPEREFTDEDESDLADALHDAAKSDLANLAGGAGFVTVNVDGGEE